MVGGEGHAAHIVEDTAQQPGPALAEHIRRIVDPPGRDPVLPDHQQRGIRLVGQGFHVREKGDGGRIDDDIIHLCPRLAQQSRHVLRGDELRRPAVGAGGKEGVERILLQIFRLIGDLALQQIGQLPLRLPSEELVLRRLVEVGVDEEHLLVPLGQR